MQVDVSPESDNTPHEDNFIIESATLVSTCVGTTWCVVQYNWESTYMSGQYKTPTADRGLRTGYKIRTTDYFGKNSANWF